MTEGVTLREYIRETLVSIAEGIADAQGQGEIGKHIGRAGFVSGEKRDGQGNTITTVDFDIATTVEARSAGGIGASVKVVALGSLEGGGRKEASTSAVSRVAFSVPLAIPKPDDQRLQDEMRNSRDERAMQRPRNWMSS